MGVHKDISTYIDFNITRRIETRLLLPVCNSNGVSPTVDWGKKVPKIKGHLKTVAQLKGSDYRTYE